jgi:hypothetical protein
MYGKPVKDMVKGSKELDTKYGKPKKKVEEARGFPLNELRATQMSSVTGPNAEIDPKTGAAKDCKRWEDGKEVPCKPNKRDRSVKESIPAFKQFYNESRK